VQEGAPTSSASGLIEVPAAFIETVPGATLAAQEVIADCRGEMASFKVPRHVPFVQEWPISATKVQQLQLRDRLLQELELGGGK
jgi:acyl-CoA synthetase (AMP-forming)/AMP-acid ligase II